MTQDETIAALRQLVKELWEVRDYGIQEMNLYNRVCRLVPDEHQEVYLAGMRPCDKNGISLVPKRIGNKISYTHHFE